MFELKDIVILVSGIFVGAILSTILSVLRKILS